MYDKAAVASGFLFELDFYISNQKPKGDVSWFLKRIEHGKEDKKTFKSDCG